jgi:hypothetical protein
VRSVYLEVGVYWELEAAAVRARRGPEQARVGIPCAERDALNRGALRLQRQLRALRQQHLRSSRRVASRRAPPQRGELGEIREIAAKGGDPGNHHVCQLNVHSASAPHSVSVALTSHQSGPVCLRVQRQLLGVIFSLSDSVRAASCATAQSRQ